MSNIADNPIFHDETAAREFLDQATAEPYPRWGRRQLHAVLGEPLDDGVLVQPDVESFVRLQQA